jgi:flavin-dependent dehydrogenase
MIDRARFDAELVERARARGAQCRFSAPLRTVLPSGAAELRDGTMIRASVVVAADGPHSPVGKATGNVNRELAETRQVSVDLLAAHGGTDIFLHPEIVGGYGWLFPKGETCNIGIGVAASRKHTLKRLLARLHEALIASGRVGADIHAHTGGSIPVGGILQLRKRLGDTEILFCGDAAGLTNPVTGAGINSAVISGRLAGEAAGDIISGDRHAPDDYSAEIEALFGKSIGLALRRRHDHMEAAREAGGPSLHQLRDGWIAYRQYWSEHGCAAAEEMAGETNMARSTA